MTATAASTAPTSAPGAAAPTIDVRDVSRWYGNVVAVNGVSFALQPGITGLLGPNGAGKSTLLHMMSGFLRPSAGQITVLGQPAWKNPELYRQVGLVPEREGFYPFLSGWEFVLASARLHSLPDPEAATKRAIAAVDMEAAQGRAMGGYSKGMRQRMKVAGAIVHEPSILLLDEPFNGADPGQRLHLMDLLRGMAADGRTIVFSSHILAEVERLAEQVLVVVAGRLAASGDFREIRRLMTDRPHTFVLRTNQNRELASRLMEDSAVTGIELADNGLRVRVADRTAFAYAAPKIARAADISIDEMIPADESLESVFSYLVNR
jgi:ABC-2 type transport system ATP-binding protein